MDRSMESRDHHYILEPVCASALLKRNCSKEPLRSRHTPRIECDIHLETIPLKLSQVLSSFLSLLLVTGVLMKGPLVGKEVRMRPSYGGCRTHCLCTHGLDVSQVSLI